MELNDEQKKIVKHRKGNMVVSASAGSGKTSTMIKRLVDIIKDKSATVDQILAVTFTEKAAYEMKEKLLAAMTEKIAEGDRYLESQLADVYNADISTVHSFCSKIIRKYFYLVGVAPDYEVLDEIKSNELLTLAIDKTFEDFYEKESGELDYLIDKFSSHRKDTSLKEAFIKVKKKSDSFEDENKVFDKTMYGCTEEGFLFYFNEYKSLLTMNVQEAIDKLSALLKKAEDEKFDYVILRVKNGIEGLKSVLESGADYSFARFAPNIDSEEKLRISDEFKEIREFIKPYIKELTSLNIDEERKKMFSQKRIILSFTSIYKEFAKNYQEEKNRINALDFADLEKKAVEILSNKTAADEIKGKYKYIFVDEYQDTNRVQEKIFSFLGSDNVFVVGDVKQSIYAFRGSDPAIFSEREERVEKANKDNVVRLNANYRSAWNVLDYVNNVMKAAMVKESSGVDYLNTSMLADGGLYNDNKGKAELLVLRYQKSQQKKSRSKVYDVYEDAFSNKEESVLGEAVAKKIKDYYQSEYYDVSSKEMKKIRYQDIAILLRSRDNALINALCRAGIPINTDEQEDVEKSFEICVLTDYLKLLDNKMQDIPLVSAMKNLFSFTEDDFAEIRAKYSKYEESKKEKTPPYFYEAVKCYSQNETDELSAKIKEFYAYIDDARILADENGAESILLKTLKDRKLEVKFLLEKDGENVMKKVSGFIKAVGGGKKLSVAEFLNRIENLDGSLSLGGGGDKDAVNVLTIHASKGLEYPVVIIPIRKKGFNYLDLQERIIIDKDNGLTFNYFDEEARICGETVKKKYVKEKTKEGERISELRLFYVAMTRAKYFLSIISDRNEPSSEVINAKKANSYIDFIPKNLPYQNVDVDGDLFKNLSDKKILVLNPESALTEKIKENLNYKYPHLEDTETPYKTSVTESLKYKSDDADALIKFGEEKIAAVPNVKIEEGKVITDRKDATEKGTAMHKFLQNCDLFSGNVKEQADNMLNSGVLSKEEFSLLDISCLETLIGSGKFFFLDGYKLYKEKEFLSKCPSKILFNKGGGEVILQGVIDLLAIKDGEGIIIDYKYSDKKAENLVKTYKKQMELYSYAVEKSLSVKVKACYLVNLKTAAFIKIDF